MSQLKQKVPKNFKEKTLHISDYAHLPHNKFIMKRFATVVLRGATGVFLQKIDLCESKTFIRDFEFDYVSESELLVKFCL